MLTRDDLREWFRYFGEVECRGESHLYELLASKVAGDDRILDLLDAAPEERRRPNLLFAAVHFLLLGGDEHPLRQYFASVGGREAPDGSAWHAFSGFCLSREERLRELLASRQTQTHEVRRSAALVAALAWLRPALTGRPVALLDIGACAGLNLLVDLYGYDFGHGRVIPAARASAPVISCAVRGERLPPLSRRPAIAWRLGVDAEPVDLSNESELRWLRACVWPESLDRLELLDQATSLGMEERPEVVSGDVIADLEAAVGRAPADAPLCITHSATLAYLDAEALLELNELLGQIASHRETYWIGLEGFGASPASDLTSDAEAIQRPGGGLLSVGVWRGEWDQRLVGFASMHGDWIDWVGIEAFEPRAKRSS